MGCAASNDDSHKGLKFILSKWLKPDELKPLDSEAAERDAFLKCVTEGKKIGTPAGELQAMNNDQLTEAFGPYFWLMEQHYYTPQELAGMTHTQIKAEAASKAGVDGGKPTYELCQELANKGTLLNLTAFNDKSVKSAAIFAFLAAPSEAASISADEVKKRLAPFVKGGEEATKGLSDEDLFNACVALGAIRGLGSLPEDKLAETEIDKQRLVLMPLAMKADGAGLADALKYKDKKAWELADSLPKTGKSIALQAFVGAYKPETEEDKKKKEEARAKKAAEKK